MRGTASSRRETQLGGPVYPCEIIKQRARHNAASTVSPKDSWDAERKSLLNASVESNNEKGMSFFMDFVVWFCVYCEKHWRRNGHLENLTKIKDVWQRQWLKYEMHELLTYWIAHTLNTKCLLAPLSLIACIKKIMESHLILERQRRPTPEPNHHCAQHHNDKEDLQKTMKTTQSFSW